MEYLEIIKLLDAGYTKEEIMKMEEPVTDPKDLKQTDPDLNQNDPDPDLNQNDPDPNQYMSEALKEIKEAFADIRKEIHAAYIMTARQKPDTEKTSEDIIANIINPFKREKEIK